MPGILYSKTTWIFAIALMAATFCFQLGEQFGGARDHAAAARLEEKLSQWDARNHPDEAADCASATVADQRDVAP